MRYLRYVKSPAHWPPGGTPGERLWLEALRRALDELEWGVPFGDERASRHAPLPSVQLVGKRFAVRCPAAADPNPPHALTLPVAIEYPEGEFFGAVQMALLQTGTVNGERIAVYACREE